MAGLAVELLWWDLVSVDMRVLCDLSLAGEEMVTQAAGWSPPHSDIPTSVLLSAGSRTIPQPVCNGSS